MNAINILEADTTCAHIHNKHLINFTWEIQAGFGISKCSNLGSDFSVELAL